MRGQGKEDGVWREWEDGASSFLMIRQSFGGVHAASENAQNREKKMEVSQCESKTMEGSSVQMNDKRNVQQEEGKSTSEMWKASKTVRCASI